MQVIGTFPSAGSLQAWAGYMGHQPVAIYALPDGKHMIHGTLIDAEAGDVDREQLTKAVNKPMGDALWHDLESSRWIADGSSKAPRVVYVFTDPKCPYCNKLWSDARPWVTSGKVQLRHVMVGILTPASPGLAAALLASPNPSATLGEYEGRQAGAIEKMLASGGRPHPLSDDSLKALDPIPSDIRAQLNSNERLMASQGISATPAVAWRDADGKVQVRVGLPDGEMADIFAPR